jgi:perosamine synthetase
MEEPHKPTSGTQKKIPLMIPVIDSEMQEAALNALRNEKLVLGESVYKFEEEFARFCGTRYAVSVSSGTAALEIVLEAANFGENSEVITTPFSFIATANVILQSRNKPVFADVNKSGYNLSPENVKKQITKKTRGLIPVHLYGHPCNMEEFREIAEDRELFLLEDAAQAHGASFDNKKVGSIGDAGCFSFYPAKNMTVGGDGGMITTSNEELAETCRSIRDCGREKGSKYSMNLIGQTSRLNTANAAIGRIQLRRLQEWNQKRIQAAKVYRRELRNVESVGLPVEETSHEVSVYHLFVITSKMRNHIKSFLEKGNVETGIHYPIPIHLQKPYRDMFGYKSSMYPRSEELSETVLSLPMYPELTEEQIVYICNLIKNSVKTTIH